SHKTPDYVSGNNPCNILNSDSNIQAAAEKNVDLVTTNLTGVPTPDIFADFECQFFSILISFQYNFLLSHKVLILSPL
ncbi:MAG: hypothetical protein LUI10_01720, partial [Lachnospiraceae bacterium]|nr:hypothetical protein [Lachnospiraceae bacterium]